MRITTGDLRREMTLDVQRKINKLLNMKKNLACYYFVITATWDGPVLNTKLIVTLRRPPMKMLNSACYFVDNQRGLLKRCWVLPLDIPLGAFEFEKGDGVESIHYDSKGMPIVN